MLEHLHIENLAVIERVDLNLSSGFSVLTGETGAGKSVLIHSLNLLWGERVSKDLIRSGCDKATVSGLFSDLPSSAVAYLNDRGFDVEDEVLIQRSVTSEGKSSIRINGSPATLSMLRECAGRLVNIHGQHDNRALLDPTTHIRYLDSFAKNEVVIHRYEEIFSQLKQILRQLSALNSDEQTRMQTIDLLTYQVGEIDAADLKIGEEEELKTRRSVLANGEKIQKVLSTACYLCSAEDGVRDELRQACYGLEEIAPFSPELESLSRRMTSLSDELDDLSAELRDYADGQSFDPAELNEVEERLDLIYRLKRKYGADIEAVLRFRDKASEELEKLNSSAETTEELTAEKERLYGLLKRAAADLTKSRQEAASLLEKNLTSQLAFLDMPNTGFKVKIEPAGTYTPKGADTVEFLLSANLGEALRPLSKIASGGELSRIMLSMKTCLTLEDEGDTLIFDEIDTGVSGKAAEKIAMKLKEISGEKQVVVVTHLAQIAAYAAHHFRIEKNTAESRTYTSVIPLDKEGRVSELARIIGGIHPTEGAVQAAEDLLKIGEGYQ